MLLGIFKHLKTHHLYDVIGIGKLKTQPEIPYIVYKQLYESVLKGTNIHLPYGSFWFREPEEFKQKFIKNPYECTTKNSSDIYLKTNHCDVIGTGRFVTHPEKLYVIKKQHHKDNVKEFLLQEFEEFENINK